MAADKWLKKLFREVKKASTTLGR
jgi:hypothetical protein